ncbi:tetratricopeptide repeat protein [Actinomadura chibensis]|uniref:Tetratricopeptide repeat protein n=1 Tax=Actinomadura chibensis TaxID=392828 RepID=A0A5D0NHU7_9ACTN|nr:tetratricopeptide repeat protein [Actinomadura chibensis]TYB43958.1 tetratricopeptide repeat protein [Actinomadura chibensis]
MSISDKDRKILWGRSGNRCAMCRRILVAERTPVDDDAIVGEEAHIGARSPGGPRFGEGRPDAVDGYENLILLCGIDHKKVDDQFQHYTAARLRAIKSEHEAWVERTLGAVPGQAGEVHLPAPEPSAETVVVPVVGTRMAAQELFVGRSRELRTLLNSLAPDKRESARKADEPGAVVVSAVAGMGGIGKTTLAQHAASAAVDRGWFPGGAVMVNLRGYDPADRRIRPGQVFAPLLYALGMAPERIPATTVEQATVYHHHLADLARRKRPVLLVLDNASTTEQVLDLLPRQKAHRAVVTTRDTLTLPSIRRIELDVLSRRESLALLRQAVRRHHPGDTRVDGDRAAGERLVQACGRLPLAVGIAAALMADDPGLTPAALADDLADAATRLDVLRHGGAAVAGVIEVSWQHLREANPGAARLLRLLTLDLGPDISTAAAAALADAPEPLVNAQLRALRQAHLLHAGNGRWRMHDLVRVHIRMVHAEGEDHQAAVTRLLDFYQTSVAAADDHFLPPSRRKGLTTFPGRLEAEAWLDTHQATLVAAVALAATSARQSVALELAVPISKHLQRRAADVNDWLAVARNACTAATEIGDTRGRAGALNLLGLALYRAERHEEGLSILRESLALWEDLGIRNRQGMLWSNIALVLVDMERFDEAIDAHEEALALYQEDGDREQEARVSTNLANAFRDLGRLDEAIAEYRRAVDLSRGTGFRDAEGRAWNHLGRTLREARRRDEALDAFRNAQTAYRDIDNRDGEGLAWRELAETLKELGRSREAIEAYRTALAVHQDSPARAGEAAAWHGYGILLFHEALLDDAIEAHRRAQALWRDLGERVNEGAAWHNLGLTLHEAGRVRTAVAAYRRALALYEHGGGAEARSRTWNALGRALAQDDRAAEARHARQQAEAVLAEGDR